MAEMSTGAANYEQNIDKMYGNQQRGRSEGSYSGRNKGYGGGNNRGDQYDSYGSSSDAAYINKMYDSNLESIKQTLQSGYETNVSNLDAEKVSAQRETDANLNRTYVESAKTAKNFNEVQNAYGLTSGAMGQAQLAKGNQLQADLTGIRNIHAEIDAEIERQRSILAKEYAAAIAKAQADNDMQRAQALYEAAKAEEERMLQLQMAAGELMAGVGDYSILAKLYGLSDDQVQMLKDYYFPEPSDGGGGGEVVTYSSGDPELVDREQIAKEVQAATVTNAQGVPSENSAYWNSVKQSAYYQ